MFVQKQHTEPMNWRGNLERTRQRKMYISYGAWNISPIIGTKSTEFIKWDDRKSDGKINQGD